MEIRNPFLFSNRWLKKDENSSLILCCLLLLHHHFNDTHNESAMSVCLGLANWCFCTHSDCKRMAFHWCASAHASSASWCVGIFYRNTCKCRDWCCCDFACAPSNCTFVEIFSNISYTPVAWNPHDVLNGLPIDALFWIWEMGTELWDHFPNLKFCLNLSK